MAGRTSFLPQPGHRHGNGLPLDDGISVCAKEPEAHHHHRREATNNGESTNRHDASRKRDTSFRQSCRCARDSPDVTARHKGKEKVADHSFLLAPNVR
jgi:hypothetical protein